VLGSSESLDPQLEGFLDTVLNVFEGNGMYNQTFESRAPQSLYGTSVKKNYGHQVTNSQIKMGKENNSRGRNGSYMGSA
jgi:hypothetical protein